MHGRTRWPWAVAVAAVLVLAGLPMPATAQFAGQPDFGSRGMAEIWMELEYPVVTGQAKRSHYYGPVILLRCEEPYEEGTQEEGSTFSGKRPVAYLDKGRLEETSPNSISAGLLAKELITGRRQMGENAFRQFAPAEVPVAGDNVVSDAPTYRSFATVATIADPTVNRARPRQGQRVIETLNRAGVTGADPLLGDYGVTLADYNQELGHNIASVFVEFFNRSGIVAQYDEAGKITYWERSPLLISWTDTMGFPVSEPYWAKVPVGGVTRWVLIQAFERRVLTYTPENDPIFRVEMGNIGLHYKVWRHPDGTCKE
jgi:polysaccharide biosynthesis protein PslG